MHLLLGATGTVGRHILRAYHGRTDIRLLVHSNRSVEEAKAAGFADVVQADLEVPASLPPAFRDVKTLLLLTPAFTRQATKELNALDAAERAGVKRVVKVSLLHTGHAPPMKLKAPHEQVEQRLASLGVSYASLQATAFMDNLLGQLDLLKQGRLLFPGGGGRVSHVDTRDVADVAFAALQDETWQGAIPMTGPEALSYDDVAARVARLSKRPIERIDPPFSAWREGAVASGMDPEWADAGVEYIDHYMQQPASIETAAIERVRAQGARRIDDFLRERIVPHLGA